MTKKQLFAGFSDEQQAAYEEEAAQRWDPAIVKVSNQKWKRYSAAEKERIGTEGEAVYAAFAAAIPAGAGSVQAQAAVEGWRSHMAYFWTPNEAQLVGLASGYNTDLRFKGRFDAIDPRLAEFILEAVQVYVSK